MMAPLSVLRGRLATAGTILIAVLIGCDTGSDVVATVDDEAISASELRAFVDGLTDGLRSPYEGAAARQHYLQSLIDRRLMLVESSARGLDTTKAFLRAMDDAGLSRLSTRYRQTVMKRAEVTDAEIEEIYRTEGYDRERKLNAILVPSRSAIDSVVNRLQAGDDFGTVAKAHSRDQRSAVQGGQLGFVDRATAERLYVPGDVFRDLPLGQVSEPLPAGGASWHVVRFVEDREATLARQRQVIGELLFTRRLQDAEAEELELLQARYDVALDQAGLQAIVEGYAARQTDGLDASDQPLFTFGDRILTIGMAQRSLLRGAPTGLLASAGSAVSVLEHLVLKPRLYAHAALDQELIEASEFEDAERRLAQSTLLEALRRQETGLVDVSETEVRQFYDDFPEHFVHERSVWAEELLLATEAEALQVRGMIESGFDFAQLVDRSLRAGAEDRSARHHYHPREEILYPKLVPTMLAAEPGALNGPLEVEGGWVVFRVAHVDEGGIEPYDDVRRRARALLLRRRQQDAFGQFLRDLRERYRARVTVHPDRLAEALPDETL